MTTEQQPIRIDVPRHLQDFNGYCGPACALMVIDSVGSKKSPPVFAQNEFFREVRDHAKKAADNRPIKSPAESLLHLLNEHADGETPWEKVYQDESLPVAEAILQAVAGQGRPCIMMVNRGMHWVVAFGMLKKPDGTPSGLLMRDPAWAGMPKFYGLSIFPDEPAIEHCQPPCTCLEAINPNKNKRTGKVHERFFTISELLSHRGLQGSLDWEGKGAIALVPKGSQGAAARIPASLVGGLGALGMPVANAREKAGQAALTAVRESGLTGGPNSPPEWDQALANARAGEPILVKDPEDSRDDFFLVPLIPQDPKAPKGAWAMLDARTLELREVSLLEDWQAPILPTPEDTHQASKQEVTLPDGSIHQFSTKDLTPNQKNLVWQPSAAAVLPYWPVKEFTAPHPVSGKPASVYLTQDGKPHGHLGPDESETPTPQQPSSSAPSKPNPLKQFTIPVVVVAAGVAAAVIIKARNPATNSAPNSNPPKKRTPIPTPDPIRELFTSDNLLDNPGFEINKSLSNGKLGEWSSQQGRINDYKNGVSPIGEWMLEFYSPDAPSQAIASQVVAIEDELSKKMTSGEATIFATASYNVSDKVDGAKAFLRVNFLSAEMSSRNLPSLSEPLVLDNDPTSWQKIELSAKLPTEASFIVVQVYFDSDSLKGNPGHVDQTNLTITVTP